MAITKVHFAKTAPNHNDVDAICGSRTAVQISEVQDMVTCARCLAKIEKDAAVLRALGLTIEREHRMMEEEAGHEYADPQSAADAPVATKVVRHTDSHGLAAVLRVPVEAPATTTPTVPAKGDLLTYKDGAEYTMVSLSKDGKCYRVTNSDGKSSYKLIANFI